MTRIIFFAMVIIISGQSCTQQTEKQETFMIRFSPTVNDTISYAITTSVNSEMEVMGQKISTDMRMSNISHLQASKVSTSEKVFDLRFSDFDMELLMNGKNANSVMSDSVLQSGITKFNAVRMQLLLDENNNIINIRNLTEIDSSLQHSNQMTQFLSQENMQQSYQTIFFNASNNLKKGDTWTTNSTYNLMGTGFQAKIIYEFLGEKDGLAYISTNGDIKGKGTMNAGTAKFDMTLDSKLKGEMQYVVKTGYLKENISTVVGTGNVMVAEKLIPMTMNGKTTMKLNR